MAVTKLKTKKRSTGGLPLGVRLLNGAKRVAALSLPYILSLSLVAFLVIGILYYASNSTIFGLKEVFVMNAGTMTSEQAFEFCELRPGENLMKLDLVNVQQVIKHKHPEYKEARVQRILPNRIHVQLKRRTPVAQLQYEHFVQIDQEMMILPGTQTTPYKNLTIIQGAYKPKGGVWVGALVQDEAAKRSVKLVEMIQKSGILRKHFLSKVDISDRKNLTLNVDGMIDIHMGDNHLIERLKILDQTLKSIDLDPAKISYLDLRFDDVVLGQRGITVESH